MSVYVRIYIYIYIYIRERERERDISDTAMTYVNYLQMRDHCAMTMQIMSVMIRRQRMMTSGCHQSLYSRIIALAAPRLMTERVGC